MSDSDLFSPVGDVMVSRRGAARWRRGHPWIYRSDVDQTAGESPGFVRVRGGRGKVIGWALYNPRSEIMLRWFADKSDRPDADRVRARIRAGLERRRTLMPGADGYRVIHGEADLLPGLFVDRYGEGLSVQTTCAGADRLEDLVTQILVEELEPRLVVVRDDSGARAREGLPQRVERVFGDGDARVQYHEGELVLEVDLLEDQKTGGYLDQTVNHVRAGSYARGDVLDCFTYHGGFALQLRHRGARVTAIDQSAAALGRAAANGARAGYDDVEWVEGNVFDELPRLQREGKHYDLIVLDPPAFASGRKTTANAMGAYREINRRALALLKPGGILISCSCSGRIRPHEFDRMLHAAALDARRRLHLVESRTAGPDHPVLAGVPETDYLKCRIAMAL